MAPEQAEWMLPGRAACMAPGQCYAPCSLISRRDPEAEMEEDRSAMVAYGRGGGRTCPCRREAD